MGLSGTSGPFRGAYNTLQFGTESVGASVGQSGSGPNAVLWVWNVPAGMDIEIVDFQLFCASVSVNTRINLLAGGASVLATSGVNSEAAMGVGLASGSSPTLGSSVQATLSTNVFGTTATSILNSVTPSAPGNVVNRGRAYGAYVLGGASLSATVSTGVGQPFAGRINGTVMFFPRTHPASLRASTE